MRFKSMAQAKYRRHLGNYHISNKKRSNGMNIAHRKMRSIAMAKERYAPYVVLPAAKLWRYEISKLLKKLRVHCHERCAAPKQPASASSINGIKLAVVAKAAHRCASSQ